MNKILYFTLLLLLFSCKNHEKESVKSQDVIVVDIDNVSLSSLPAINDFDFVNLEVTEASMLADIGKVISYKDKLYVLSIAEPTVFIFSKLGKFEQKIQKGQGPGEILSVSDLAVYNDTLFVLDNYRNIKMYSLEGEYLKDKMILKSPYFSFALNTGGMYLFDPNINVKSDFNLCFVPNTGEREEFLKKDKSFRDISILNYNTFTNSEYVVWPLSNIIYKMNSKGEVNPIYEFDFKGKWISGQDFKSAVTNADMCGGKLDDYVRWLKDFVPLKNGCFFSFKYHKKDYFVKYQDDKLTIYSTLFENMPEMRESSVGCVGDSLVYTYSIADLKEYMEKYGISNEEKISSIYKICENEDANPVLVFASVK